MKKNIIFFFLVLAQLFRRLVARSETSYLLLFVPGFEGARWQIGKWKAWRVFEKAKKDVPAYKDFLQKQSFFSLSVKAFNPQLQEVPIINKENYIKQYSIEERCFGGTIPGAGVVIDESSGTSGIPNNWVRGPKERAAIKRIVQFALHNIIGKEPFFLLNAFALGPWATGMNVSMSLVDIAILKSVGPDVKKIENTLKLFGPKYRYVIMGYPPFLKTLVDSAEIQWKEFNIIAIFGGEGISEGMRKYLSKGFAKLYGSYGASDLEINIAAENDFTIRLRQLLVENRAFANDLLDGLMPTLPMVFQYNPIDYYIETNGENELIVTLCRDSNVSPKIRYNIHDVGKVVRFPKLLKVLSQHAISLSSLGKPGTDLPLLFHFGRSDMAVAFYGCKITPQDIQEVVSSLSELASNISSFSLITYEDEAVNKKLTLALELREGIKSLKENKNDLTKKIFVRLTEVNQDYRESSHMIPKDSEPGIEIHLFGTGPFADDDIRLKKHYIQKR